MKLELKYLSPYLPYKLKCLRGKEIFVLNGIRDWIGWSGYFDDKHGSTAVPISVIKPIFRPMSDLPDDIFADFGFADEEDFLVCLRDGSINYCDYIKLISQHFDVFGLIDSGLSIDINTVPELLNG